MGIVVPLHLVAVDPGKHMTAIAEFRVGKLTRASYLPTDDLQNYAHKSATLVVVETPVLRTCSPVRKSDQMDLMFAAGQAAAHYKGPHTEVVEVQPNSWKGTLPETITTSRIIALLDSNERRVLEISVSGIPGSKRHNVYDAVGIGLFGLHRARRGCIPA